MAEKESRQPTHRAYSVVRREGQDDYWLNIGLVFAHKDNGGFNLCSPSTPQSLPITDSPPLVPTTNTATPTATSTSQHASKKPKNTNIRASSGGIWRILVESGLISQDMPVYASNSSRKSKK